MSPHQGHVIVGGGLAAARAAAALRETGFSGSVTIVGDEVHQPYLRPPLSKDYLQGSSGADALMVQPRDWYDDNDVALLLGTTATDLNLDTSTISLSNGSELAFDAMLIATGSRARQLNVPGADVDGVLYLRRVEDSDRIKESFALRPRVVIVGAGWIGLETAAAARMAGLNVTVLERDRLPLNRVLGPEVATFIANLHMTKGVTLRPGVQVDSLVASKGRVTGVRLADGEVVDADVVIVGVGARPNVEIAERASLAVNDGIVVDEQLRTAHPRVFAAGDVANAFHPRLGRLIRVEHWANAKAQGYAAGLNMGGVLTTYDTLPFLYSDQYDVGFEYTGYAPAGGYDSVVFRGDPADREFIAFWLDAGRVVAGMNVNVWDVSEVIADLISRRLVPDVRKLIDPDVPLSSLAEA